MGNSLTDFGLAGIFIAFLISIIWYLLKDIRKERQMHRDERKEWKKTTEDQFKVIADDKKEQATILTRISTLLENRE